MILFIFIFFFCFGFSQKQGDHIDGVVAIVEYKVVLKSSVYEQALLAENIKLDNPNEFINRMNRALEKAL